MQNTAPAMFAYPQEAHLELKSIMRRFFWANSSDVHAEIGPAALYSVVKKVTSGQSAIARNIGAYAHEYDRINGLIASSNDVYAMVMIASDMASETIAARSVREG